MRALIMIDVERDFCPGGSLAVKEGNAIVPVLNQLIEEFHDAGDLVVATRDMHPADHCSFVTSHPGASLGDIVECDGLEQILWPVHCVVGTPGGEFHPDLDTDKVDIFVDKGVDSNVDSYSAFFDNAHRRDTGLAARLKDAGVSEVWIVGLAIDYCVRASALDALELGFDVVLVPEATGVIDVHPGDGERVYAELVGKGCRVSRVSKGRFV